MSFFGKKKLTAPLLSSRCMEAPVYWWGKPRISVCLVGISFVPALLFLSCQVTVSEDERAYVLVSQVLLPSEDKLS